MGATITGWVTDTASELPYVTAAEMTWPGTVSYGDWIHL